jgi:hypothetical protein
VFGPDGALVHPVRGWASAPCDDTGTDPAPRRYPAVMDRVGPWDW